MKTYALIIAFLLISLMGYSQKYPMKYGKLADNELNLNEYQGAGAVVLCDFGQYYFDAKLGRVFFYFKRHLRIKILSEEGLKYAKQTIPFYDLKAATYYPNNTGYEIRGSF